MGRILILVGLAVAALGVLMTLGVPFGRLPGDVVLRRSNFTLSFPIVTCIVISVVLTLLLSLWRR